MSPNASHNHCAHASSRAHKPGRQVPIQPRHLPQPCSRAETETDVTAVLRTEEAPAASPLLTALVPFLGIKTTLPSFFVVPGGHSVGD